MPFVRVEKVMDFHRGRVLQWPLPLGWTLQLHGVLRWPRWMRDELGWSVVQCGPLVAFRR